MVHKSHWQPFYEAEQQFFEYLSQVTQVIYQISNCAPEYQTVVNELGKVETIAPSYVRSLRSVTNKDTLAQILAQAEEVKRCYARAKAEDSGLPLDQIKPHHRALQYVGHLDAVTLSKTKAHRSVVVKRKNKNEVVVFRSAIPRSAMMAQKLREQVHEMRDALIQVHGLKSAALSTSGTKKRCWQITLSQRDLLNYFNAKDLTVRELSGSQYMADLSYSSQGLPITRTNFGLLLTDNPKAEMLMARPRKQRANALELIAERVYLPIQSRYEFFKKQ